MSETRRATRDNGIDPVQPRKDHAHKNSKNRKWSLLKQGGEVEIMDGLVSLLLVPKEL